MTRSLDAAGEIVARGVGTRYTAAVLRVERGGKAVFEAAYGALDDGLNARPTVVDTRFDLASLTKIFVGAAALFAVMDGAFGLDEAAARLLPEWRAGEHATITPRMLLAHTSGMQSGADYRTLFGRNVESFALTQPLAALPGAGVLYSDLGFIALGVLVARARGASLARVCEDACERLRCDATAFRPRNDRPEIIPATEYDAWRGRVRGAVHDEKAYLMTGVAGHAGLFGTAGDVAKLGEAFLGSLRGRPSAFSYDISRAAVTEQGADPVLRRGLAWALKTSALNSCGAVMHESTFGHTGFTGTCVWIDPTRDLSVTLLSNAVFYGRHDLRDVRAAVCEAAASAA